MQPSAHAPELVTYREAAELLGLSPNYVSHLASRRVLHSVKLPGERQKYLRRDEVDWYDQRRQGKMMPNPVDVIDEGTRGPTAPVPDVTTNLADAQQAIERMNPEELAKATPAGLALALLILALLLALLFKQEPDKDKLEQLRTSPQLQPVRRAILKLASEIAA
jgi:excisionase family DNA binding protein